MDGHRSYELTSGAAALSVALGVASGGAIALVALFLKGGIQSGLLALAPCVPFLLFQDCVRYTLLSTNRAKEAFWNDLCWLVFTVAFMLILRRTDTVSVELAVLAFGAAVIPSALLGVRQIKLVRPWHYMTLWLTTTAPFAWRITIEYVIYTVSSMTMVLTVIALTAPIESVGFVRSAQTMMGPMSVFFAATTIYLQPELTRLRQQSLPVLGVAVRGTVLNVAFTAVWFGILSVVPKSAGTRVFGASWEGAQEVLWVVAILFGISGVGAGATNLLRSQRRIRVSVNARLFGLVIVVPATVYSAVTSDAKTTLVTFAATSMVTPVVLWVIAVRPGNSPATA